MTYIINWTQTGTPPDGKPAITLPPLTLDSTSTSLVLTGKGTPNYGEIQQENFIRLLENFASQTSPSNPTVGQTWFNTEDNSLYQYDENGEWRRVGGIFKAPIAPIGMYEGDLWWDTLNNKLFVYDESEWGQIWPSLSIIPVAFVDEYNLLVDIYNKIAATPTQQIAPTSEMEIAKVVNNVVVYTSEPIDSVIPNKPYGTWYGYSQVQLPYATISDMTNAKWIDLLSKFQSLAQHQGTDLTGFATNGYILTKDTTHGVVTALNEYKAAIPVIAEIEKNRFNVNPMSLESSLLSNSSHSRTSSYFNAKSHDVAFTFQSIDHIRGFFNSGGKFNIDLGFTAGQSTVFTTAWSDFISSIGTISFSVFNTSYSGSSIDTPGFYSLTLGGVYSTIFNVVSSLSSSTGSYVNIKARLENVPNTSEITLRFSITFAPDGINNVYGNVYQGAYNSSNSSAVGTTSSSITTVKANEIYLSDLEIPYPSASQSGTFITDTSI